MTPKTKMPLDFIIEKILARRDGLWCDNKEIVVFSYVKDRGNNGIYVLYNYRKSLRANDDDYHPITNELYGPWYYQKTYISFDSLIYTAEHSGIHSARERKLLKLKIMEGWNIK